LKYEICISDAVLAELRRCPEPKRGNLFKLLTQIIYNNVRISKEIRELAREYVERKIIPAKYINDALHIATVTVSQCNVLVSWNFQHIVKAKTIFGVNGVNNLLGYKELQLASPVMMIDEE